MKTLLLGNGVVSLDDVHPYQNISLTPEAAFDDLTRLAASICQTLIALLCLIDTKRRWLKSQVGLDPSSAQAYLALCTETILQPESWDSRVLVVEDVLADRRFANQELVKSQTSVRFYAAAPLVTPQGLVLGILAVMDRVPRSLSLTQQQALAALSTQAIAQLELRKDLSNPQGGGKKRQLLRKAPKAIERDVAALAHSMLPEAAIGLKSRYQEAIESALEKTLLVAITDRRGTIKYVNDAFCQTSKYSREELLGKDHRLMNSGCHSLDFFKQMWATIRKGNVWKGEIKNRAKDGSFYWVSTAIVPILNAWGKPDEYVSICQDITEHMRMKEERLTQVGHQTDRFFTLSPDLMCILGFEGNFQQVNPAFEKILSYTPEELLSTSFLDRVHPEDKAATQAELEKLTQITASINIENRYRCRDGSYKWLAWTLCGQVEEGVLYAIGRELAKKPSVKSTLLERGSERATALTHLSTLEADVGTALGQSSTLSESLQRCTEAIVQHLDVIGAGIWTVDSAAGGAETLLPLDLQASAGRLLPANAFPAHVPPSHHLIGAIAQTKQPLSTQLSSQGRQVGIGSTTFSGFPLIVESRLVGVMALHSHHRLSKVVHNVLDWVTNVIAIAIDRAWGRDELLTHREALLCRLANQIRHFPGLDTILNTAVTEVRSLLDVDCCHFLWYFSEPDRSILSVTHEACNPGLPSLLGERLPPRLEGLAEIVSQQKTLRINDVSQATELDSDTRSLLIDWGLVSALLLPLKTHTGQLGAIACIHYKGSRQWSDPEVELLQAVVDQLAIAIEQAELFASTRAAALAAQTQAHHLELALQDLEQTEAWLIQTEKMSGLGQMVAGVAHEINNPVNFITGNLSHAHNYIQDLLDLIHYYQQYYPNPVPEIQEFIEEIDLEFLIEDLPKILSSMKMGANRINEIVLSLRNFSRLDDTEMKPINLHEGIDSTLLILHNRMKPAGNFPGIEVIKEYGNLPPVECYAGQINQVFMNIISNAIDALENLRTQQTQPISREEVPENGRVQNPDDSTAATVRERTMPAAPTIWIHTEMVDNNQVLIRIRDNGAGMEQSVVNRLFDPFFTTKPVGKGTGLGLSISYQIVVERHRGSLKCISEPGQGAEFLIQIPVKGLDTEN